MKGASQDKKIIDGDLVKSIVEVTVINQTTGLVDDDEGEDDPVVLSKKYCVYSQNAHILSIYGSARYPRHTSSATIILLLLTHDIKGVSSCSC